MNEYPIWRLRHVQWEPRLELDERNGVSLPDLYRPGETPSAPVRFRVVDGRQAPDFPVAGAWPVMSTRAAALFQGHVTCSPVEILAADGSVHDDTHVLVTTHHLLDALDLERSQMGENPWLPEAPPAPRTPYLRRDIDYPPIFRVRHFEVPLFVTREAAGWTERANLHGFGFQCPDGPL